MASYRAPRIMGWITKLMASLFVFGVCGILVWRVFFSTAIPKSIDVMTPNPKLTEAYLENGSDLSFRYQELSSISRAEDSYGYFSVESCVFIPEAEQVQLIFRYNNSTIRHLQQDYGLTELPEKSQHLFDVSLVITDDLTPETHEDDDRGENLESRRILPSATPIREETALYTFYRYVFDDVSVEDVTNSVYLDVYYVEDVNYDSRPYSSLLLYAWDETWLDYRPTKSDWKAIRKS